MTAPVKLNFKMYQGSTFSEVIRWESSTKAYAPITGITKAAPMVVSSNAHGIPLGWRTKITNVVGMKEVNSSDTYYTVTNTTLNSITFNAVNSLGYTDYTSGGVLEYNVPVDLTGYTARMQLRAKLADTNTIDEYTTQNGKILIDTAGYGITILVDPITTAGYNFTTALYSLEVVSGAGAVTQLAAGTITLIKEVTR